MADGKNNYSFAPGDRLLLTRNLFDGIWIPTAVVADSRLKDISKLAIGVLAKEIGKADSCILNHDVFALNLGVSVDTIGRIQRELEGLGLASHRRTGRANHYHLSWHPGLAASLLNSATALRQLQPGSCYSPYQKFVSITIPCTLVSSPELDARDKLLYGRLSLYLNGSGRCCPSDERLAQDLGCSINAVRVSRAALQKIGLIDYLTARSDSEGRPDYYHFLFQPILAASLRPSATGPTLRYRQTAVSAGDTAASRPDPATLRRDTAKRRTAYKEEKIEKSPYKEREDLGRHSDFSEVCLSSQDADLLHDSLLHFQKWIQTPLDKDPKCIPLIISMMLANDLSVYQLKAILHKIWTRMSRIGLPDRHADTWRYIVHAVNEELANNRAVETPRSVRSQNVSQNRGINQDLGRKRAYEPADRSDLRVEPLVTRGTLNTALSNQAGERVQMDSSRRQGKPGAQSISVCIRDCIADMVPLSHENLPDQSAFPDKRIDGRSNQEGERPLPTAGDGKRPETPADAQPVQTGTLVDCGKTNSRPVADTECGMQRTTSPPISQTQRTSVDEFPAGTSIIGSPTVAGIAESKLTIDLLVQASYQLEMNFLGDALLRSELFDSGSHLELRVPESYQIWMRRELLERALAYLHLNYEVHGHWKDLGRWFIRPRM